MLKIDQNSSYVELKDFLEDIYIYLNNQISEYNEETAEAEHKPIIDLINRCKHMLNIYEFEFEPKSDQPYLEMNGNHKLDQPCEYVDVTSPVAEVTPSKTLEIACNEQVNFEPKGTDIEAIIQCPFSGLPAAHLTIKKSPKIGNLQRIKEKTYIFNQSKMKYYCGLLDGWLLMYSSNSELKPTICLNLQNYDLCNSDLHRKREQFQLISNEYRTDFSRSSKKYLLQATSSGDYEEWLIAITTSTKSSSQTRIRLNSITRKLPSPPLSPNGNESVPQTRLSDRSEGIYEEPSEMFSLQLYPSFQFDNWTQLPVAPTLPVKSVSKSKGESTETVAYDIPKSPPKPTVPDAEHQNKIQQVKTQLTMQMLVSKQSAGPSINAENEKPKSKKKIKIETSDVPKFTKRNWFLNRLSGRNVTPNRVKMEMVNAIVRDSSGSSEHVSESRLDTKRGGKVNMIINQLEANGHFQSRKEKFKESRYSSCSANADDEDCHNYEPVVVAGRKR